MPLDVIKEIQLLGLRNVLSRLTSEARRRFNATESLRCEVGDNLGNVLFLLCGRGGCWLLFGWDSFHAAP
jgi:hypothetical protein